MRIILKVSFVIVEYDVNKMYIQENRYIVMRMQEE